MVKIRELASEDPPKAKKKLLLLEDPPSASSTDDDEITDSSSDEPSNPVQNSSPRVAAVKDVVVSVSSSDDEEDEDSGKKQTLSATDSGESESKSESLKPKTKRPFEEAESSVHVKRSKKKDDKEMETDTEPKKAYFQRLWSEEDEIVILKGLINFKYKFGKMPTAEDANCLYDSVKNSLTYEGKNLVQFINKVYTLKKKYKANMNKGEKLSFSKPHDENCFELSKLLWRPDLTTTKKENTKVESLEPQDEDVEGNWFKNSFLVSSIVGFGMDEESLKKKWSLVPMEMKKKIHEQWKVLERKQLQFALEKIALVHEVVSMLP